MHQIVWHLNIDNSFHYNIFLRTKKLNRLFMTSDILGTDNLLMMHFLSLLKNRSAMTNET